MAKHTRWFESERGDVWTVTTDTVTGSEHKRWIHFGCESRFGPHLLKTGKKLTQ